MLNMSHQFDEQNHKKIRLFLANPLKSVKRQDVFNIVSTAPI